MKIKVITVDDHPLIRSGIKLSLLSQKESYNVIGEAGSGKELFSLLNRGLLPDVLLLDIIMPEMTGVEIARIIRQDYPQIGILMLSSESNLNTILELVNIGIDGYISKNYTNRELCNAIDNIANGVEYFGRDISQIIRDIHNSKPQISDITFTEREREIIKLCSEGLSAKEIADRLCLSSRTVSNHKQNIFAKMGINSKYEMVQYAIEKGIININ